MLLIKSTAPLSPLCLNNKGLLITNGCYCLYALGSIKQYCYLLLGRESGVKVIKCTGSLFLLFGFWSDLMLVNRLGVGIAIQQNLLCNRGCDHCH